MELGRLYKRVRQIMDFHAACDQLPVIQERRVNLDAELEKLESAGASGNPAVDKKNRKEIGRLKGKISEQREQVGELESKIAAVRSDSELLLQAEQHSDMLRRFQLKRQNCIPTMRKPGSLNEFLPCCREDIRRIYDRLGIKFDHELGESFYHNLLPVVVQSLGDKGLSRESEGATCVFMDNYDTPMIIRKKDGAFLYATTDLATIQYRVEQWKPTAILYVVDHRQHQHFEKLFDAARLWGFPTSR